MLKRLSLLVAWLCLLILIIAGCDNDNSVDEGEGTTPLPEQRVSGIWWGFVTPEGSGTSTFVMGAISEEGEVRLVSDTSQYVGPAGALEVYPNTVYVSGAFSEYLYDEDTLDDYFDVTSSASDYTGFILARALVLEKTVQGGGETIQLYYNTTYTEVAPNVAGMKGVWHLANTTGYGDSVSLVIIPDVANTTSGTIRVKRGMSGTDMMTGTDILSPGTVSIYYSHDRPYNIYNVQGLATTLDDIDLSGFAAYIDEHNEEGAVVSRTMAIGVSSASSTNPVKSFSGLATFYKTLTP